LAPEGFDVSSLAGNLVASFNNPGIFFIVANVNWKF